MSIDSSWRLYVSGVCIFIRQADENVDYQRWADHIEEIFRKNGRKPETVVDLGCGTGAVTNILAERGYQVTGVDISEDMLFVAREKARKSGLQVSYICQDMTELTLHRPVDAIICMCDGFNYILEEAKLKQTFQRIYQYLNPGGIWYLISAPITSWLRYLAIIPWPTVMKR